MQLLHNIRIDLRSFEPEDELYNEEDNDLYDEEEETGTPLADHQRRIVEYLRTPMRTYRVAHNGTTIGPIIWATPYDETPF
jgi:hypothetical protein